MVVATCFVSPLSPCFESKAVLTPRQWNGQREIIFKKLLEKQVFLVTEFTEILKHKQLLRWSPLNPGVRLIFTSAKSRFSSLHSDWTESKKRQLIPAHRIPSVHSLLHKTQLLRSLSCCNNRSTLFLMGMHKGSGKLICASRPTHGSRSGWGRVGYFRITPPHTHTSPQAPTWAADCSYQPPYIKRAISPKTGRHPRNVHRHRL